jgi:hypothetical protein
VIPILDSPNTLAVESAYIHEQGSQGLAAIEAEVTTLGEVAVEAKTAADKVVSELTALATMETANREERSRLRNQKQEEDASALDEWQRGADSYASHAARSSAQAVQIEYLTQRDVFATNVLRPRLTVASMRADAAMCLASANLLFAKALVAGVRRHEALQASVAVDGQAQIPAEGGLANDLLKQATVMAGRAAEISASADAAERLIAIRERNL